MQKHIHNKIRVWTNKKVPDNKTNIEKVTALLIYPY